MTILVTELSSEGNEGNDRNEENEESPSIDCMEIPQEALFQMRFQK